VKRVGWLVGGLVALLLLFAVGELQDRKRDEAIRVERDSAQAAQAVASHLREQYNALARSIEESARTSSKQDTVLLTRIKVVRQAPAPDTCSAFIEARDVLIDDAVQQARTWRETFERQREATAKLQIAGDSLESANRHLTKALDIATQPRGLGWRLLHPRLGFGATAGIDIHGKPNAVVGGSITF
jgi:hypothetical protein